MAEPFLSEIRIFSFNFPPKSWAFCNGQFLPINQNQALFSLLGTTYGGNGQTTFALPNLQGRVPIHVGAGHALGEAAGTTAVTITQQTMPQHLHFLQGTSTVGTQAVPTGNVPALFNLTIYSNNITNLTAFAASSVSSVGGSQAHENMQPYLTLNFCIALQGIFPSQN
ncbi:MAG TPA: tail fiber protein [Thermoanaerobaculia bacterium]|jgi:microcystin-dependent protein|nr:tail fiber protein [Thermoanaerobaculia bacterium]